MMRFLGPWTATIRARLAIVIWVYWVWFDGNWCFKSLQENVWSEKCRSSRLTARWRWSEFPILILVNRIANSWLFGSFENCLAIFFKSMEHGCFVRNFLKNIHLISWKAKIFKICEKKYPLFFYWSTRKIKDKNKRETIRKKKLREITKNMLNN